MSSVWSVDGTNDAWTEIATTVRGTNHTFVLSCPVAFRLMAVPSPTDAAATQRVPVDNAIGICYPPGAVVTLDTPAYMEGAVEVSERYFVKVDVISRYEAPFSIWVPGQNVAAEPGAFIQVEDAS